MSNPNAYNPQGQSYGGVVQPNYRVKQQGNIVMLGTQFDTFVVDLNQRPVGAGAMGTVFVGVSQRDRRRVAVKMVNPAYAGIPSIRRRAREEAHLAYRHPHLIEMIACCETPNPHGPMFIISNFINGMTLDKHVERNLRGLDNPVKRICETIFPVLDALSYLHAKGVYHLDIKPTNIMMENGRNIRLMDLGIAFSRDAAEITSAGLLGTPGYAAPEQYVSPGTPLEVDARTDLYELGITLYELLAGHKPTEREQNPDAPLEPIPGVSKRVMNFLNKATHPDKEQRFSSAQSMSFGLANALQRPPGPTPNPKYIVIGIVGAAVLVLAILVSMILIF